MQISHTEELDAPIDHVFAACTDFADFKRRAEARGARITRKDDMAAPGVGLAWTVATTLHGRDRLIDVEVVKFEPPDAMALRSQTGGLDGLAVLDLREIRGGRTQMGLAIDIKAESFPARLVLQTLKLARVRLTRQLRLRLGGFARRVDADWRAGQRALEQG